jgi:quercetin dioxygenase-like cupin family protein
MEIIKSSKIKWIEGKGELNYKKRILTDKIPKAVNLIQEAIMPPNGKIPQHSHTKTDEIFYLVEGKIQLNSKDKKTEIKKGDIIIINKNEPHGFENKTNKNAKLLVLKINFEKDDAILY